jgi:hypothetical protein
MMRICCAGDRKLCRDRRTNIGIIVGGSAVP